MELTERYCKICGKPFMPNTRTEKTCSKECKLINKRTVSRERRAIVKREQRKQVKQKSKTDWAAIMRTCKAAGLSYGEATAKGII